MSILSYAPVFLIFSLAIYQFWKGKGFLFRGLLNGYKKESPDLDEQEFRKKGLRTLIILFVLLLVIDATINRFR